MLRNKKNGIFLKKYCNKFKNMLYFYVEELTQCLKWIT